MNDNFLWLLFILAGVRGMPKLPGGSLPLPSGVANGPFGDPFGGISSSQMSESSAIGNQGGGIPASAKSCALKDIPHTKRIGNDNCVDCTVVYECVNGYKATSGNDLRTCQPTGKWNGKDLVCVPVQCGSLPTIPHATPSSSNKTYTAIVTFTCQPGYTKSGNIKQTTCLASKKWSNIDLKCNPVDCGSPQNINNANYSPKTTTYPSSVTWACNKGYETTGKPAVIRCQQNGKWTKASMQCKAKRCKAPPSITNASPTSKSTVYTVGTLVKYKCNSGYSHIGDTDSSLCQANQTWSKDSDHIKCLEPLKPTPLGFWPLTHKHGSKDTSTRQNHGDSKNLKLAAGPTGVPKTAHEFAGTLNSYIIIKNAKGLDVGGYGSSGSFSYTSYIYNTKAAGCFFEWYKGWQQTHIWSWSVNNLYIHMHMRDRSSGFNRNLAAPPNTWNFMGISYNYKTGSILFQVNDNIRTYYVGRRWAQTDARTIYMGARPNSYNGIFKGKMSCVMLFGQALDRGQLQYIRKYCKNFLNHMATGCKSIPSVKHAVPSQNTDTSVGAKVKFTCIDGYKRSGTTSQTVCQNDKTWSSMNMKCQVDPSLQFQGTPKPIGYWPLTYRTKCNDVSGNHNHGVCNNLQQVPDKKGRSGMAHSFSGSSTSHMVIKDPKGLDVGSRGGSFTYTSMVYSQRRSACFFEWWEGGQQTHIWSWPGPNLYIYFYPKNRSYGWKRAITAPLYTWSFLGLSFDYQKATLTLKVNSKVQTFSVPRKLPLTTAKFIYIGMRPNDRNGDFLGKMSCVMLFDKSLDNMEMESVSQFCENQPK